MDPVPLIATALFFQGVREAPRLIVSPSEALPLTRSCHSWTGHDNLSEIKISLYYGLVDVRPLGTWRISEIPPLPRNQANITVNIHLDQIGQLTVTAKWQDRSLPITVSSHGVLTQLPLGTLPLKSLAAHLHAGQGRGTIDHYDAYREYGVIAVENTTLLIPFVKPPERDGGHQLFENGDQVAFTIAHGQVAQVRRTLPHDPRYHHFWCDHCAKYLEYAETTEAWQDGTWGEYRVWTCNACHAEVMPATCDSARS